MIDRTENDIHPDHTQTFGRSRPNFRARSTPGGGSRLLDDVARLMTDAAGVAQGARREVETVMRSQAERVAQNLDLVSREEFDAARAMAAKARAENDELRTMIAALEARVAALETAKPAAKRKPAAKKAD